VQVGEDVESDVTRREGGAPTEDAEWLTALVFGFGAERYALETRFVREVLTGAAITFVPDAPEILAGLTLYRGEILPVVHLGGALGLPRAAAARDASIVVVGTSRAELGFPVDEFCDVSAVAASSLEPAPQARRRGGLLRGVCSGLLVLDGERLLADRRFYLQRA
jgi:chemotaxis signal transduction protein